MGPLKVKTAKIVRRKAVVKVPENNAPLKSLGGYHHFCRLTSSSLELANPQVVVSHFLYVFVFLVIVFLSILSRQGIAFAELLATIWFGLSSNEQDVWEQRAIHEEVIPTAAPMASLAKKQKR